VADISAEVVLVRVMEESELIVMLEVGVVVASEVVVAECVTLVRPVEDIGIDDAMMMSLLAEEVVEGTVTPADTR